MKFRSIAAAAAVLTCATASAQTLIPSPSPGATINYGLYFGPGLSHLMVDNGNPLNLNPPLQFTDSRNCNVIYRKDGEITCYTASSCPADVNIIPFCAMAFSGPAGLSLSDIVALSPLPVSGITAGLSLREIPASSGNLSPSAIFEAMKKPSR